MRPQGGASWGSTAAPCSFYFSKLTDRKRTVNQKTDEPSGNTTFGATNPPSGSHRVTVTFGARRPLLFGVESLATLISLLENDSISSGSTFTGMGARSEERRVGKGSG